jgi:hypothetical protein
MRNALLAALAALPFASLPTFAGDDSSPFAYTGSGSGAAGMTVATAQAAELAPLQGFRKEFGAGASALVYYTAERDGHHVVTTVQASEDEGAAVFRFTAVLADGQTSEVSMPRGPGQPAVTLKLIRQGARLRVEEPALLAMAQ